MSTEAKEMQAFALEQMLKVKDIVSTIRNHHGPSVGDRMTLIANMVSHLHQSTVLEASLLAMALHAEGEQDVDPVRLLHAVGVFMNLADRSQMLPVATFQVLFTEEEKEVLLPFMSSIDEILGLIVKRLVNKIVG